MAGNGNSPGKLRPRQRRAIAVLLSAKDAKAAAALVGVGERTLYRWMTDPTFQAALTKAEGDVIDQATRRLINMQGTAIDAFAETFARLNEQAGLNVAEFFTEEAYRDPVTMLPSTHLVLDIGKITALGHLVKKMRVKDNEIEVEAYDAQQAAVAKMRTAQVVLETLLKLVELRNVETRLAALEAAIYDKHK